MPSINWERDRGAHGAPVNKVGFKFRYEALLTYRGHIKERAEISLSRAQQRLKDEKALLAHYEACLFEAKRFLESAPKQRFSSEELKNHSDYISGLGVRIDDRGQKVAECEGRFKKKWKNFWSRQENIRSLKN